MLPKELAKQVPKTHLMSEEEWRRLGVQQSLGWVHYMIHEPEPHILLFRRPLPKDQQKWIALHFYLLGHSVYIVVFSEYKDYDPHNHSCAQAVFLTAPELWECFLHWAAIFLFYVFVLLSHLFLGFFFSFRPLANKVYVFHLYDVTIAYGKKCIER